MSLQERLWNDAYDKVKLSEPQLVEDYEQILSTVLDKTETRSASRKPIVNIMGKDRETRSRQMQQLVMNGLDRTQKEASIKHSIDGVLQVWQTLRGTVDKAMQMAPEAVVAWAGVCLGLEVCISNFPPARVPRNVLT